MNTNRELYIKLKYPISRAGDIQIKRKFDGLKAQTLLFPSVLKSAPEDLNISRYGDYEIINEINMIHQNCKF